MQTGPVSIYILTATSTGYVLTSTIDNYESLTFSRSFFGIGTFDFQMMADAMQAQFVAVDSVVIIGDNYGGAQARVGIIQTVDRAVGEDSKKILRATGIEAKGMLAWRMVDPGTSARYTATGTIESVLKALVDVQCVTTTDANRAFPLFTVAPTQARGATYTLAERWSNLSEAIQKACIATETGWAVSWSGSGFIFDVLFGFDRTMGNGVNNPCVISTDFDTSRESHFMLTKSNYKNYSYTGGQGVGTARVIRPVYSGASVPTGFSRREMFTDARDLITNADLDTRGAQSLGEFSYESYVEAVVNPYATFAQSSGVDLGDLVTLDSFGVSQTSRVTGITEQWGAGGYDAQFALDRQLPTVQTIAGNESYKQSRVSSFTEIDDDCGRIIMAAYSTPDPGWLDCNGQAISRTTYANLYSKIGTTWGTGNGSTTFNVPDMREAAPVGVGTFSAVTGTTRGAQVAADVYTLGGFKDDQLQGHYHSLKGSHAGNNVPGQYYLPSTNVNYFGNTDELSGSVTNPISGVKGAITDYTNGTPRTGTTTRGKRMGVYFFIKY